MKQRLSHKVVVDAAWQAVWRAVGQAACGAVHPDADRGVWEAVHWPVKEAMNGAVDGAAAEVVRAGPPQPNLDLFLAEILQTRRGAE